MNDNRTAAEIRDRVQHHIVAALATGASDRLVFKGGTMLRVCALPDYRYSEDLDFDWAGAPGGFRAEVATAVAAARSTSGTFLRAEGADGPRCEIGWSHQGYYGTIDAEATLVGEVAVPTQEWPLLPNHRDLPPSPPIRGYTLEAVMADKLSCVSRRAAARDFYDLHSLLTHGVDIHEAWQIYVEEFNNWRRQYGWRVFPSDIQSSYRRRLASIATDWQERVATHHLPEGPAFGEVLSHVDKAVAGALTEWLSHLEPGELRRLKQAHDRIRPRRDLSL